MKDIYTTQILNPTDKSILFNNLKGELKNTLHIVFIFFVVGIYAIYVKMNNNQAEKNILLIVYLFFLIIIILLIMNKYIIDLIKNRKIVFISTIRNMADYNLTDDFMYIQLTLPNQSIGNFKINSMIVNDLNIGDKIQIEFTPKTKILLSVSNLENNIYSNVIL